MKKIILILSLFIVLKTSAQVPGDTATLRTDVNNWITTNGIHQITGGNLNSILNGILNLKLNILDGQWNLKWINVLQHGVKGDGTTDDHDSLQAVISTAPHGAIVYLPSVLSASNPNGYYLIGKSLIDTNEVRIMGASPHSAVLFATSGFVGYFLLRNWTDTQSATDSMPSACPYFAYPDIENLGFAMGGGLTNVSFIGVANYNETSYIGHIIFNPSSNCVRVRGICITGINGGKIEDITAYGSTSTAPWGSELYIPGIGAGSGAGASLFVDTWVSSQNFHSESPFYIKGLHNLRMTHFNIEGTAGNVADGAVIRLVNSYGFSLTESIINVHSAGTSRPLIRSTNTTISGGSATSPTIQNVEVLGRSNMTGNVIEDSSQSGNAYVISPTAYFVDYIDLYNGQEFDIRDNTAPNLSIPRHYNLHAGLINFEGWAAAAPASGTYAVGDRIWNTNPTQTGGLSHWVCTAVTPGTAVAFVSSSSNTNAAQTVVVTAPTGIANNDILVAIVMNSASGTPGTPSFPAGFTNLGVTYASGNYKFNVGWKRASSESGNYTFDGASGCTNISAAISVYRNCLATGSPFNIQYSGNDYTTNNTTIESTPGFIPTSSGRVIWAGFAQGTAQTIAVPSAFTQRENPALINTTRIAIADSAYIYGTNTVGIITGVLGVSTAVKRADAFVLLGQGATWKAVADSTASGAAAWGTITGTLSAQTDLNTALGLLAPLASPTFTGVPAAPTAAVGTNTTQLATTAFAEAVGQGADQLSIMKSLGSPALAISPGVASIGEASLTMASGTVVFAAVYLRTPQTITGVKCALNVQGSFTNNNYNGIGLYSVSGATLTLVASSADDAGAGWKSAAGSTVTEAFSSPYAAAAGTYFAAFLYNSSAQTTAPTLYSTAGGSGGQQGFTLTNSQKQNGSLTGQNTLPATTTGAALAGIGNVVAFILY